MSGTELRPRSGTEIVDAAIQLYRRHFLELLALYSLVFAPLVLLTVVLTGAPPTDTTAGAALMVGTAAIGWVFGSLAESAMAVAVSNSYLHDAADVPGALRRALRRIVPILLASLVKWLLISLAFAGALFAAIIPGAILVGIGGGFGIGAVLVMIVGLAVAAAAALYLFCRYFAVSAAVVLEGVGVGGALRRSRDLSAGYKTKVALTLALPMVLLGVLQFVVSATLHLVLAAVPLVAALLEQAIGLLVGPIISVIAVLLYYDARMVKEGFDIEMLSADLGEDASLAPAAPQV